MNVLVWEIGNERVKVKVLSQRRSSCCRAKLGTSSLLSSSFLRVGENNCVVQLRTPSSRFEDESSLFEISRLMPG